MLNKRKIAIASLIVFAAANTALAAEFVAPSKSADPNVTVSASETRRNLYVAGANVAVNANIQGDLYAAGSMVSVIGDVEEDLNAAGGSLSLSGKVDGDTRLLGGNITISSPLGGDLLVAGGNISITEKASIGGDLIIGGGNVVLDAPVKGNIKAGSGNITINSKVEGDVQIYVSGGKNKNQGAVVFGPKAEVLGKITHKGPQEAVIKDGAKVGAIDFTLKKPAGGKGALAGFMTAAFFIKLLAWFLVGWILVKYRKNPLTKIVENIKAKPWENLGIGLAGLVTAPILSVLLLFTLVGYYLAGILVLWYILLLMFSGIVAAVFLGAWLMKLISKSENFELDWKSVALGVVVLSLLKFVPVLGWLACFAVFLMALGGLLRAAKEKWTNENDKN